MLGRSKGEKEDVPLILEEEIDLVERLGTGQYGEVWKGIQMRGGQETCVAVKIFKKICRSDTVANELRIMKELQEVNSQSRNLVDVVETNIMNSNGRKCLVLEYLAGKELFDRIVDKGYYTEQEAAMTIAVLARALSLLHSKNIIHRDLKPENIVYRSADAIADPVIVDFGFAIMANNLAPDGTCYHEDVNAFTPLGTHGYISPESYESCLYTSKSDMWALGVMTYTILVGFPPFDSKDKQLSLRTRRGKYYPLNSPPWKGISDEAKDLVDKMLCVDVVERLSADQVLEHPWIRKHVASSGQAPAAQDEGLGQEYLERLQRLQSKQKFKKAVNGIVWSIRLRKAAVQQALLKSGKEEVSMEVENPMIESVAANNNTMEQDNVLPRISSNPALQLAGELQKTASTTGNNGEPLVVSLDQIQRLASGLSRNASYKLGRTDSQPYDSPGSAVADAKRLNRKGSAGALFGGGLSGGIKKHTDSLSSLQVESDAQSVRALSTNMSVAEDEKLDDDMRPRMKRMSSSVLNTFNEGGGVNYEEFCAAVMHVGMPMLATRHVFEAFDQSGTGVVSVTEFMSTMVGFRGDIMQASRSLSISGGGGDTADTTSRSESKPEDGTAERQADLKKMKCEFFFNIFDLDGSGFISREELFHVVAVLLSDVEDAEKNTFVRRHRKSLDGNPSAAMTSEAVSAATAAAAAAVTATTGNTVSPHRPRNSFASISQLVGMAEGDADSGKSSPTGKRSQREALTEEALLDFHPEHHNNMTIGNEGVEIDFNSLFESIDTDGSGEISYEEFEIWFNKGDSSGLFIGLLDDIDAVQAQFKEHFGETFSASPEVKMKVDAT